MKKLTSENVNTIFMDCLFQEGEDTSDPALAEGVLNKFGFHKGRLESHREEILELLLQLPDEFHLSKGGGWSFLNACMTRDGDHWAEHATIEQLLVLGLATNQARYLMPRKQWGIMPGGMPYFSVGVETTTQEAA